MGKFKCLSDLDKANIFYTYIPFTQKATAESLADDWRGKCGIIAHEWLMRKLTQDNLLTQTTYAITQPNLPHPVVMGDNTIAGPDITQTHKLLNSIYAKKERTESNIEHPNAAALSALSMQQKIDSLINYIGSQPCHHGVINTLFYLKPDDTPAGHTVSFVKRNDQISFFDPNQGEISFSSFDDFRIWFKKEAYEGNLKFLIADENEKKLLDIFPSDSFTAKEANVNSLSMHLNSVNEKKISDRQDLMIQVGSYSVISYSSDHFINPNNFKIIQALKSHIEPREGVKGVGERFDPSLKMAEQFLKVLTECKENQPLFDAMMVVFASSYPGPVLKEKVANTLGYINVNQLNASCMEKLVKQFSPEKLHDVNNDILKPAEKSIRAGRMPDMQILADSVNNLLLERSSSLNLSSPK